MSMDGARSDAELVAGCLMGDRDAFAGIVERYQRLLCSLAYSATGDLARSEDIAQEAFVTAWQQLGTLREPEKLGSWLRGIVRNGIRRTRRLADRDPLAMGTAEAVLDMLPDAEHCAHGQAVEKEEQQLLWRVMQTVPESYREPMILYYRHDQSVSAVAASLELTESAVKQRLKRGRKMLEERLLQFVEGALVRSRPGTLFTASVVAAVATMAPPAKAAATVGLSATAAAKISTTAKTVSLLGILAMFSGLISTLFGLRAGLDQARTLRERRATVRTAALAFGSFMLFIAAIVAMRFAASQWAAHAAVIAVASQVVIVGFAVGWSLLFRRLLRQARALRGEERQCNPQAFADSRDAAESAAGTFRSRARLFGIPLVHIRFAGAEAGSRPVFGWIAGGDRAIGILFAWGGFACGLVSVGAVSLGVFTLGGVGIGLLALGSVAFGYIAMGAMTMGQHAVGSLSALGWESAIGGGFVISRNYAVGPVAFAAQANTEAARAFFAHPHVDTVTMVFYLTVVLLTLVPVYFYAKGVRRRLGRGSQS